MESQGGSAHTSRLVVLLVGTSLACSGEPECPVCETDVVETGDTDVGDTDTGDTDTGDTDTGDTDTGTPETGDCEDFATRRHAYFGDLHVHTSYSFDSYGVGNSRSGPAEAYRYAKGYPVSLPPFDEDGVSARLPVQITKPLDFTAVTDHSEFIGERLLCTTPDSEAYYDRECINFRNTNLVEENLSLDITFGTWGLGLTLDPPQRPSLCDDADCEAAQVDAWTVLRGLTEDANEPCAFTAFHGYEYTNQDSTSMLHRNVIFRTATVPERPISSIDALNWKELAESLQSSCNDQPDCEALAIPHNPNWGAGRMFMPTLPDGSPMDAESASLRAEMMPLIEMIQIKQNSECRNGFSYYAGPVDEECDFEQRKLDVEECDPANPTGDCVSSLDFVRNILKAGMEHQQALGVNPFQFGFIASTDTHNATPGNTDEGIYEGGHGSGDETAELQVQSEGLFTYHENPGGLAVVWARENTRAEIFDAMKRKETYATSGTRPIVRFFGGVPEDICDAPDFVATGDAEGVPMGGLLHDVIDDGKVTLAVHALQDPDSVGLQQIDIVKTWIDEDGQPQEKVFNITPDADYTASVDLETCIPTGPSRTEICATWTDDDFDPERPATYYARVLEAPTCRWSAWTCLRQAVDCDDPPEALEEACCSEEAPRTIRERAWTSPVFYEP